MSAKKTPTISVVIPSYNRANYILAALESAHAVAEAMGLARDKPKDHVIVVCLSGRGDKDAAEIARLKDSAGQ